MLASAASSGRNQTLIVSDTGRRAGPSKAPDVTALHTPQHMRHAFHASSPYALPPHSHDEHDTIHTIPQGGRGHPYSLRARLHPDLVCIPISSASRLHPDHVCISSACRLHLVCIPIRSAGLRDQASPDPCFVGPAAIASVTPVARAPSRSPRAAGRT